MSEKVRLNIRGWNLKQKLESNGKMKIAFKLNKEESEAYKSWSVAIKPPEISDDDFMKSIFFYGITAINEQAKGLVTKELAKKKLEQQKLETQTSDQNQTNEQS